MWLFWWFPAGMRVDELAAFRGRLEEFAGEVFALLARADQRVKGGLYLRGLLLDGRRKSMQPMAGRLGVDHQQLQQFMTSSTWPVDMVRVGLARRAVAVVRPQVWVVDDTGFPKDGVSSPGVARQHSGTLGKVGNRQIGVSVHAASDSASCPLSWRLFLPHSWDGAEAATKGPLPDSRGRAPPAEVAARAGHARRAGRRRAAARGAGRGHRLRGEHAASATAWKTAAWPTRCRSGGEMTAHAESAVPHQPPYEGLGPRPLSRYRTRPVSLREHVLTQGRDSAVAVTWRKGAKAAMSARFVFLRVRLVSRRPKPAPDGVIPLRWLIAQWPEGENEPVKYWISNLPTDIPAHDLVRLAKLRWRTEHDYRELKTTLGLDHFEGRSFTGQHRHVTLVTAAHLFLTEQRTCPKVPARA